MSQYNKTVLTNAGLELAKRANAGQAKFEITRAVTSADDWSNKTIQDLEEATAIPNIMQQGTIMDAEEVESNNSVIGVSLCFTNKDLSTSYQIRVIGLYVKEEGQDKDFLYAVTTAVSPEYMPGFGDKVLYRFNMQMYLVIGKAQAVNVVINEGTAVTHGQFDKYKGEVSEDLKRIEENHKEDMSHVVKSASVNGGAEILPDGSGKLNLIVPDPDLSKYVSLEQLGELLKAKADITAVPDKTDTEEGIKQAKELAQEADIKAQSALDNKADKTTVEENLATKANQSDLDQTNAEVAKKADSSDVSIDISNLQNQVDSKTSGTIVTAYDIASKTPTRETNRYIDRWLVDQGVLAQFADQINQLKGRRTVDAPDFNNLTDTGTYYVSNPGANKPTGSCGNLLVSNGAGHRTSQMYFPDDGSALYMRELDETTWHGWIQLATTAQVNDAKNTANWDNINGRPQDQINRINVDGPLFKYLTQFNNWGDLFDGYSANGVTATNGSRLVAFKDDTNGSITVGGHGAGIAFGGDDTKGVLSVCWGWRNSHLARITGGNGTSPVWSEDIAWKSDINSLQGTVNGKADKTDVASLQNTVNNIGSTRTPIVFGNSGDDLFAFKTNQIRLYNGNGSTCKNLPPAENIHWFSVQYVFEGPNNNGIAIYRTPHNEIWTVGCNAGSYTLDFGKGWLRVANSNDISNLQSTINQQNQTIQSLITRLNNAENEIKYIKDNYIEGKRFPASQEAQAEAWENEKPTRLAMIEK
ncbi:hypothetical protein AO203_09480 [Lactobacillus gallinarum]|nr:hypothetical protein AO203_09480 [Lactobacillus gallinarum]